MLSTQTDHAERAAIDETHDDAGKYLLVSFGARGDRPGGIESRNLHRLETVNTTEQKGNLTK